MATTWSQEAGMSGDVDVADVTDYVTTATNAATAAESSATDAASSATDAESSATDAASSASAAASSASSASSSASAAQTAKTDAETAETNAETAQTAAETAKTAAQTAQTAAESAETSAQSYAANALASETAAGTSETNAATSATSASNSATAASQSASAADTSEANALTYSQNAASSATQAGTYAQNAEDSATDAAASLAALGDEVADATNAASAASASATAAAASASAANVSEGNASVSASEAAASATAAANSATAINAFYLGASSSAPTTDLNGDALTEGDWYFNTTDNATYVYDGSGWQVISYETQLVSDSTPQLGGDLDTNGNDITFGDNDKAIFGAGNDLQIYHDGNHSLISEQGTGNLYIRASTGLYLQDNNGDNYATFIDGGASTVYYGHSPKLATTSTGIDVTGTVTADGLTVDNKIDTTSDSYGIELKHTSQSNSLHLGHVVDAVGGFIYSGATYGSSYNYTPDGTSASGIQFRPANIKFTTNNNLTSGVSFSPTLRMNIEYNGDISFYEDTGTTAKFFWDASEESLNIGGNTNYNYNINAGDSGIGINSTGVAQLVMRGTEFRLQGVSESPMTFRTSNTERMRIDSSGNLLVGKTSTDTNTVGHSLLTNGSTYHIRDGGASGIFNRKTSDGDIVGFQKDGTTVGAIGSYLGDRIYIGSGDTSLNFHPAGDAIYPSSSGNTRSGAINLGTSFSKFKDLYLSGGVYLGGTGSANHLDDYEEGTWTPVVSDGTNNATTSAAEGTYTKVGRQVTLSGRFVLSSTGSTSGGIRITGLPFAVSFGNAGRGSLNVSYATNFSLSAGNSITGSPAPGASHIYLGVWDLAGGTSDLFATELTSTSTLYFSAVYFT